MTDQVSKFRPILACAALAVVLAAGGAQSAATLKGNPALPPETETAEQLYADAPDGVDPIVTGPVSAAFKQQQKTAGCDTAVWPKIPVACYPD